jgi:hypothetical protein
VSQQIGDDVATVHADESELAPMQQNPELTVCILLSED